MRVSQQLLMESTYRELDRNAQRLLNLQEQAASARRVLKPSDDPMAALRILDVRSDLGRIDPSLRSGQYVKSWVSLTESSLSGMQDALMRAKELAVSQASATADADTRSMTAAEVKEIYDQVVQLANTRLGDRYIFGGTQTQTPAVTRDGLYNPSFQGNDQQIEIPMGQGETIPMNSTARDVLEAPGVLATLRDLIVAMEGNDPDGISAALDGLDQGIDALGTAQADLGARVGSLDGRADDLRERQLDLQETLSVYQDADMAKVLTDLTNQQTIYEAALKTTAMITRVNLMDFLS
jgi:flagellar hook-associated protein 3 FlgL